MRGISSPVKWVYDGISKSFRTGGLERELQMIQLSATRCSCIAILWISLVSFAVNTLCVASQRAFIDVNGYFVIDSVRNLLATLSYSHAYVWRALCTSQKDLNRPHCSAYTYFGRWMHARGAVYVCPPVIFKLLLWNYSTDFDEIWFFEVYIKHH
jgi:hypothetical protein